MLGTLGRPDLDVGEDSLPEEETFKAENSKNEEELRGRRLRKFLQKEGNLIAAQHLAQYFPIS